MSGSPTIAQIPQAVQREHGECPHCHGHIAFVRPTKTTKYPCPRCGKKIKIHGRPKDYVTPFSQPIPNTEPSTPETPAPFSQPLTTSTPNTANTDMQTQNAKAKKAKPEYVPAPVAPSQKLRCIIARNTAGDVPLVLAIKTVKASAKTFDVSVQKKPLGFLVEPERAFMIAPVNKWWGLRHEQMPYLMYDIDEATAMWYVDKHGNKRYALLRRAKEMQGVFMPSPVLGVIKKMEAYYAAYKARQKSGKPEGQTMIIILALMAGIAIGIVLGQILFKGGVGIPTTTSTTVKTTMSMIQMFLMRGR